MPINSRLFFFHTFFLSFHTFLLYMFLHHLHSKVREIMANGVKASFGDSAKDMFGQLGLPVSRRLWLNFEYNLVKVLDFF